MKTKIIDLIKKFRAESERNWNPRAGYPSDYCRVRSLAFDECADELEELLGEEK